jgi:DNA-binding MarR family transcriptional regulator
MGENAASSSELRQAVEGFWETIPPFWRSIQGFVHKVAAEKYDISGEQFHLLRHIRKGINTVSSLAETRGISRPAVSQTVELLVNRKLVQRQVDREDRRLVRLELTPEGKKTMDVIFETARRWLAAKFSMLSREEVVSLAAAFNSLRRML